MKKVWGWTGGVLAAVLLLFGLDRLAVGGLVHETEPSRLSAPGVYYLRPPGDRHGATDKPSLRIEAEGGTADDRYAHRLTAVVEPGSEDVVRLTKRGPDCGGSATRMTCSVVGNSVNYTTNVRLTPSAAGGSEAGDTGYLRFTFTVKGGKTLTARTKVVVGEPVVEIGRTGPVKGVRPGAVVTTPFVVRNTGERTVRGLGIRFGADEMEFAERYANCRYPGKYGRDAICRFPDLRIAPGESVVIRPGLKTRASKTLMYEDLVQKAWPLDVGPGEYSDWMNGGDSGDGPTLKPETALKPGTGTSAAKGIHSYAQGEVRTSVGLGIRSDYAVSASALHGAPGDTRRLRLTVRNDGPGDPGASSALLFTPPPGAEVVKQPMEEIDEDAYEPYCDRVGEDYRCRIDQLQPGRSRTFEFTLRLGGPAAGGVRVEDYGPNYSDPPDRLNKLGRQDPDPDNDEAPVTVTD
jgi:hypothetical protein